MFFKAVSFCKYLLKFLPLSAVNIYNYLWRHHGQFVTEQLRISKLKSATTFILTCKNGNFIPIFARARQILQAEMKFKQRLLRQTTK